jgi:pimeloyl-ACP methyl ester carboxylesterase
VGEWFWRMPVIGDSYSRTMADLGHVSVTVERLGYNTSGHAPGRKTCVGGDADIAHQIVQQLRAGTYSGSIHPQFTKVGLAGHSLGGAITEIEAASFQDVDAAAVLSYADLAPTPSVLLGSLTWGPKCVLGGVPSDGVPGFAYLTRNVADYQKNFLKNTPAAALPQATASRELNPCGDFTSILSAIPLDSLLITKIKVPVLVMSGTKDLVFDASRVKLQSALFRGSPKVTTKIVTGATHGITLEPTKTDIVANLDAWLTENGL